MDPTNKNILFYDSYSVLLLNPSGRIRRLYTPFKVNCISSIENLRINAILYVDEVFEDPDDILLYKINGNLYAYKHFNIHINF